MAIITAPENHTTLDRYKEISRRLALAEGLTDEQARALAAISALEPGRGALLFGVTGSGKTLVYLEAVRQALAALQEERPWIW